MGISTKHPVYSAAKRLVMAVQAGDEPGAANLLIQRIKLEINKQEIKSKEAQLKQDFDRLYVNHIKQESERGLCK